MVKRRFGAESRNRSQAVRHVRGLGRVLPHSLEAEENLLSCCFLDGADMLARCQEAEVDADSFFEPRNGLVFACMMEMHGRGVPIDVATVAEELTSQRKIEKLASVEGDGVRFLTGVSGRLPTTAQAGFYIERVRECALLRALVKAASEAVEGAYDYSGGGVMQSEGVVRAMDRLQELRERAAHGLPAVVSLDRMLAAAPAEPPMLLERVIHEGAVVLVAAPSKAHKTWLLLDLSLSVSHGLPFWGMRTKKAPVLHIDLELPAWNLARRLRDIATARGVTGSEGLFPWGLRGFGKSIDELRSLIVAKARRIGARMIVVEPAYVVMGDRDEIDNKDVTEFLGVLQAIARETGAAVVCAHHFAKGNSSEKEVKDRASGAGAWARMPDVMVTLTPLKEEEAEGAFRVDFVLRLAAAKKEIGVKWVHPCMVPVDGLDLNALREAGRPKEQTKSADKVLDMLRDLIALKLKRPARFEEWAAVAAKNEVSRSTFKNRVAELKASGAVVEREGGYEPNPLRK